MKFFERGREYESRFVNHQYEESEKEILGKYESLDYFTPYSTVYKVRYL